MSNNHIHIAQTNSHRPFGNQKPAVFISEVIIRCLKILSSASRMESISHFSIQYARGPSETTLTNKNSIQEEINSILKLGNACYYSVQNLLSSSLLSKKLKIKLYRTIIVPVVLYGCETWSLTLREERRLRLFENRVLRRVFGPKRDEVTGKWRKLHNEELSDLTAYRKLCGW